MERYNHVSKKGLVIWQIYAAVIFAVFLVLPFWLLRPFSFWWSLIIYPAAAIYMVFAFILLPLAHNRIVYGVNDKYVILKKGFITTKRQIIARDKIILCSLIETPFTAIFRIANVVIMSAGAEIRINNLDTKKAEILMNTCQNYLMDK